MRIGTVLRNDNVYDKSPIKYTIYVGEYGEYYNMIYPYKNGVRYTSERKEYVGIGKDIHPVGKTNVLKQMVSLLGMELLNYK